MNTNYKTARLFLRELNTDDNAFIFDLVNTAGWIKFIGDRNIRTTKDADNYIEKIISNPAISYRVVTLQDNQTPIGLVTFIKRDYLNYPDIGFAFLPAYNRQGYAFEASNEILQHLLNTGEHETILATTVPANIASIQLLKKLGFSLNKEITNNGELLHVFAINKN